VHVEDPAQKMQAVWNRPQKRTVDDLAAFNSEIFVQWCSQKILMGWVEFIWRKLGILNTRKKP